MLSFSSSTKETDFSRNSSSLHPPYKYQYRRPCPLETAPYIQYNGIHTSRLPLHLSHLPKILVRHLLRDPALTISQPIFPLLLANDQRDRAIASAFHVRGSGLGLSDREGDD